MIKRLFLTVIILALAGAILAGLYVWNEVNFPASTTDRAQSFTIAQGQGVKDIATNLKAQGLIRTPVAFEIYTYIKHAQSQYTDGVYTLNATMSIRDIFQVLTTDASAPEEQITLLEGWTAKDMGQYLEKQGVVSADDFIDTASVHDSRSIISDTTYAFLADRPATATLEGFLFPDTYRVYKTSTANQIIKKMLDNFGNKFTDQMKSDAAAGNMSIFQIVTLASIIEKEVRSDTDRKLVAGIFYDRLNQGVALQSDATVNYATGNSSLQPTFDELGVDSPYNTYMYKGLPPGPICNPSLSAMMAAIYPTKSDYFYFLTKPDGTVVYSATYDEHLQNKQKYLQ
ncbi:MAG: endolytic transglycosylase MltG [Patescibacteria group bacterium]